MSHFVASTRVTVLTNDKEHTKLYAAEIPFGTKIYIWSATVRFMTSTNHSQCHKSTDNVHKDTPSPLNQIKYKMRLWEKQNYLPLPKSLVFISYYKRSSNSRLSSCLQVRRVPCLSNGRGAPNGAERAVGVHKFALSW